MLTDNLGSVSVGPGSVVLENAKVTGTAEKPTVLGSNVIVFPHSRIDADVKIHDRSVVNAGAVIESGVNIPEDCVIKQGSVVKKGSELAPGEIWAGSPAKKVGMVDDSVKDNLEEFAKAISENGIYHQMENNKDVFEVFYERQAAKDRTLWAEDILEDHMNSSASHFPLYLNMQMNKDVDCDKRGLIYNKGEDKGPESRIEPSDIK